MSSQCSIVLLESALAGDLSADDEALLNRHLDECEQCSAALEQMAGGAAWCQEAAALLVKDALDEALPAREEWSDADFTVEHLEPAEEPGMLGRLGGYDVLEIIGRGGMGVVLKGYDHELKRCIAIKVLAPQFAQSSLARKRFTREAQAAASVVHPNVLAIHQVHPNGRLPFLVMPLVAGESLAQRLTVQGRLELKETLRIGMQAAAGLAAAHEQGLVHRDVKPANILLEKGVERAVLTDFGLARAADDVTLTRWGVIAGTPQYMSPEQARGEPLDGRSDLFSLGCVLYEMATGVSPFKTESVMATMRRLVDESPQSIGSLNPELPPWFVAIVDRLLEKDPAGRFNSAKEVSELLEDCLAHVQQPGSVPLPAALPKPARRTWFSNVFHFKGVIAMIAALGLGVLGTFLLLSEPPDIAGTWTGEDWGTVVLTKAGDKEYTGTYTDTDYKQRGEIQLRWSRIERQYNGTWREGDHRSGDLSVYKVGDEIRGAMTTDPKSQPNAPGLHGLTWTRVKGTVGGEGERGPRGRISELIRDEVGRQIKEAGASYGELSVPVAEQRDDATPFAVHYRRLRGFTGKDGTRLQNADGVFIMNYIGGGRWEGSLAGTKFTVSVGKADKIDLPFVNDPDVLGRWKSVDYVANPSQFNPDKPTWKEDLVFKGLTFLPDGKTSLASQTWTKGAVIHSGDKTVSHYEIKEIKGERYMFREWKSGDVVILGLKPKYYVLRWSGSGDNRENLSAAVEDAVDTISTCAEGDPRVTAAIKSLKELKEADVVKELSRFLGSKTANVRRAAIYVLWKGKFTSIETAVPELMRLCRHEEDFTRGMAALALGGNRVGSSLDTLEKMTSEDRSGYARRCAAIALGFLGNPAAIPVLEKALNDPETFVRKNAEAALKMLRAKAAEKSTSATRTFPLRFKLASDMANDLRQILLDHAGQEAKPSANNREIAVTAPADVMNRMQTFITVMDWPDNITRQPNFEYPRETVMYAARSFFYACAIEDAEEVFSKLLSLHVLAELKGETKSKNYLDYSMGQAPDAEWEKSLRGDWPGKKEAIERLVHEWNRYPLSRITEESGVAIGFGEKHFCSVSFDGAPKDFYSITIEPGRTGRGAGTESYFFSTLPPWWKPLEKKDAAPASDPRSSSPPRR